jgi:hypothetical protein
MSSISFSTLQKAQEKLETVKTLITTHFEKTSSNSNLLTIYNEGLTIYLEWYPRTYMIITTMAVYYGLPTDFNAAIYDANSLLKQLRRQLRKIARRLSPDKHPILD